MWGNLIVLHDDAEERETREFDGFVSWHTCMRSVYIADDRLVNKADVPEDISYYSGFKAYQLILEIVTGVHSRLFGESEILSQFRDRFRKENLADSPFSKNLHKLRDQILEQTKIVRSRFLTGQGRQTYGSIADSFLKSGEPISLFGSGKLAEAILPYLIQKHRSVTVVARNPSRLSELKNRFSIDTCLWEDYTDQSESLVIASSFFPETFTINSKSKRLIIDFRAEAELKEIPANSRYVPFKEILANITKTENHLTKLRPEILTFIEELTLEREEEQIHLLHGWEDLACLEK
ncbi:NAD(P)-binding domain-containing protein [Leptospira sp. 'Mane']|uniref:NAD(P)-binding domain-containing protein n=1 Tax=Leptospira sp. 'Mane' TaxID=3387407 RepID=UPI00398BAAAE